MLERIGRGWGTLGTVVMLACTPGSARAELAVEAWSATVPVIPGASFVLADSGIDGAGNVYVLGTWSSGSDTQMWLVSYDPQGKRRWTAKLGAAQTLTQAHALAVDAQGNVWVAVAVSPLGSDDRDVQVTRFDSAGAAQWTATWSGAAHLADSPNGLVADAQGNAWVTGYTTRDGFTTDTIIIKYGPAGQELWTATWDSGGDDHPGDFGQPIVVDGAGNVYVAGESGIASYGSDGKLRWSNTERAESIALAPDGSVYTTAPQQTLKLDADGHLSWRASGVGGTVLGVSAAGVVTSGSVIKPNQDWDQRTVRLDAQGHKLWERTFDGGTQDRVGALKLDAAGNAYVVGETWVPRGLPVCVTVKYDPNGVLVWSATHAGAGNGRTLALDGNRRVIVSGLTGTTVAYTLKPTAPCAWWQR